MSIQIFFAVITAFLIVALAYYYLNWKAMLWLGGLFLVASTVALLLNYQNDGISVAIPAGGDLFRHGSSISILSEYRWLAWLGMLTGVVLMISGAVKRMRMPSPELSTSEGHKPLSELEKISQEIGEVIDDTQHQLGDPSEHGKDDALNPGGVNPAMGATEPQGFERNARELYQERGTSFVRDTVGRLKEEIMDALATLASLKNALVEGYYANKATAAYRDNANVPGRGRIDRLRQNVNIAWQEHDKFVGGLGLRPSANPDWDNPTSFKQLIWIGIIAAVIEFAVSYFFLKGYLGNVPAIKIALIAMVVVLMLACVAAATFRFMRRPHEMPKRVLAGIGYVALLGFFFLGLGLLLDYRAFEDAVSAGNIADVFKKMLTGYYSLLTSIENLVLFLINLLAFVLFYCKCLLFFEKFSGYRRVVEKRDRTQKEWAAMFERNGATIKESLDHTSEEARANRKIAIDAVNRLHEKKAVLENIPAKLTPVLHNLRLAYSTDIGEYRKSNIQHRNVQVNPQPDFFKSDPPFRKVEEYFTEDHGGAEFLAQHQQAIAQADDTRQDIEKSVTDWPGDRARLNDQWTSEFEKLINQ